MVDGASWLRILVLPHSNLLTCEIRTGSTSHTRAITCASKVGLIPMTTTNLKTTKIITTTTTTVLINKINRHAHLINCIKRFPFSSGLEATPRRAERRARQVVIWRYVCKLFKIDPLERLHRRFSRARDSR